MICYGISGVVNCIVLTLVIMDINHHLSKFWLR